MKEETRRSKLAELLGMASPPPPDYGAAYRADTSSREAEAALAYVDDSRKFMQKECKNCGLVFAVNRGNVSYCSDGCRERSLAAIGIKWDASKNPEERWDFREPLTVLPQVLPHLRQIADQKVQQERELAEQRSQEELSAVLDLDVDALTEGLL